MLINHTRRRWDKLPITPLHYPVAYLIHKLNKNLNYPGLIVGCMFPDLEIPIFYYLTHSRVRDRLVLHSLLGAATLGTFLALGFTILIYPRLVSYLFGFDTNDIRKRCQISSTLALSCLLGNLSHVLLDVTVHEYNPIFWPILSADNTFNPICPLLGGSTNAGLIVSSIMLILLTAIFIYAYTRKDFWRQLLVGE